MTEISGQVATLALWQGEEPSAKDPSALAPRKPVPPHSAETEAAVLSAWMMSDPFAQAWRPDPDLFHVPRHRAIAAAMAEVEPKMRDETAVLASLDRQGMLVAIGGASALFAVTHQAPMYGDPFPHVAVLRELAGLRSLLRVLEQATAEAYAHKSLSATVTKVQEAVRAGSLATGALVFSVADLVEMVATRDLAQIVLASCPSGLPRFDVQSGGFRKGLCAVLGASTSWGKSTFAVMLSDETLRRQMKPLLVSWEDPEELYARRLVARRARISAICLRDNTLTREQRTRLLGLTTTAEKHPFFLNAIGKSVERVAADIRAICLGEGIDLVICDYLQAISCEKRIQDRRNEITYIARTLTDVIKASHAAGLLLSQLKRLMKRGDKPDLHDLKESGDIENAAEMVLIGYQGEHGEARISVEKNKDGPKNKEYGLAWDLDTCAFVGELEVEDNDEPELARAPSSFRTFGPPDNRRDGERD